MTRVGIEQPADHPLVLRSMFRGLPFEELNAVLRERDRHFHAFLAKCERLRGRKKVGNDFQFAQRLIGVSDFPGHKFVCPFASNRHQRFE
ncbi:hypothetical protein D3C83_31080 [compost metagenome]